MSESTINILFLAAVPKGVAPLSIDKEYRDIEDVLDESLQGMRFRLFRHAKVQRPELERTLSTFQPHIVHFAGHGSENGSLLVEGTDGNRWELDRDTIRTIFKAYGQSVKMAVLNACYSEVTANVLRESVSYVVANSIAVFDERSITFSKTFYSTLFKDETLHKCFREALKAVQNKDPQGALTPQLLTTPSSPDPRTIKPLSSWLRAVAQAPGRSGPRLQDLMPPGSTPSRADARRALEKYLPLVDDFNQFIAEAFPETFARFGGGMNRVACTTLVIQLHSPEEILHQLAVFLTADARTHVCETSSERPPALSFTITLEGAATITDDFREQVRTILERIAEDQSLRIKRLRVGSIIIELEGSEEGYHRILAAIQSAVFQEILGHRIQSIKIVRDALLQVNTEQSTSMGQTASGLQQDVLSCSELRKIISRILVTDSMLDAFVLDCF